MPAHARQDIVRFGEVGIYHTWSRCVQRAFLCGFDPVTEVDYGYRRPWIAGLIEYQASVFAMDVGSYSILSNHFHLLLRIRPDLVAGWTDEQCAWRWKRAWPQFLDQQWIKEPTDQEIEILLDDPEKMARIRSSLGSLSWMLARIKEPIAKLCNLEAGRKGHFYEQRFGSREIEGDADLLCNLLYCDLNQIKAGMAASLESSDCSAIQLRLEAERERAIAVMAEKSRDGFYRGQVDEGEYEFSREQAESFYRDSWLAPITDQGPLATQEALLLASANPTTLVLDEEKEPQDTTAAHAAEPPENGTVDEPAATSAPTSLPAARSRCTPKERTRHRRLVKQLPRRTSELTFLDLSATQYLELVQRLATNLTAGVPEAISETHSDLRDASPNNWRKSVRSFSIWVLAKLRDAASAPAGVLELLAVAQPRGDPPG